MPLEWVQTRPGRHSLEVRQFSSRWQPPHKEGAPYGIDVGAFIDHFDIRHPYVQEVLYSFSPLVFLLGKVEKQRTAYGSPLFDKNPDGVFRPVWFVTEGSGMFGLTHEDDAMRWKGIFNHIMGSTRQVYWLATRLKELTSKERKRFQVRGFSFNEFDQIHPAQLRGFMLVSHAGRRQMDEYILHSLRDTAHPSGDSGANTTKLLRNWDAPDLFLKLIRVESHADHLAVIGDTHRFSNIVDNILTWADWRFGQTPMTLQARFDGLSGRTSPDILEVLKACGNQFESALIDILGPAVISDMVQAPPSSWETHIREAYCASAGLRTEDVFPGYRQE